jgi:hypothetical protein
MWPFRAVGPTATLFAYTRLGEIRRRGLEFAMEAAGLRPS